MTEASRRGAVGGCEADGPENEPKDQEGIWMVRCVVEACLLVGWLSSLARVLRDLACSFGWRISCAMDRTMYRAVSDRSSENSRPPHSRKMVYENI